MIGMGADVLSGSVSHVAQAWMSHAIGSLDISSLFSRNSRAPVATVAAGKPVNGDLEDAGGALNSAGKSIQSGSKQSSQSLTQAAGTIAEAGSFLIAAMSGSGKSKSAGIGGLIGMAAGAFIPGVGAGLGGAIGGILGGLFADGGDPPLGKFSVVGERGPELIAPKAGMRVFSNSQSRAMLSGGGGHTVNVIHNGDVNANDPGQVKRMQDGIAWSVTKALPVAHN
jgi:hypothetical protein